MSEKIYVSFGKGKEHIRRIVISETGEEIINQDYHYPSDVVSLSVQQLLKYHQDLQE